MHKFTLLLLAIILITACDDDDNNFVGSGNLISEMRDAADFTDINASQSIRVSIRQSDTFSLTIQADDNLIDRVEANVQDGELRLAMKPGQYRASTVRATVTLPSLQRIEASTSSDVRIEGFEQPADDWTFVLNTSSQLSVLNSSVRNLDVSGFTSSEMSCFGLGTVATNVNLATSASLEISVSERLSGTASTSSEVVFRGDPEVSVEVNTSARVRRE